MTVLNTFQLSTTSPKIKEKSQKHYRDHQDFTESVSC